MSLVIHGASKTVRKPRVSVVIISKVEEKKMMMTSPLPPKFVVLSGSVCVCFRMKSKYYIHELIEERMH